MTDALLAFLKARLDDDERVARACAGDGTWTVEDLEVYAPDLSDDVRTQAARHDPARTLREVEAKRAALAAYSATVSAREEAARLVQKARTSGWDPIMAELEESSAIHKRDALYEVLRLLALPYSDHPGYEEALRS
ncbi:hypothetical protein IX27_18235 [Streptomyces sp. JS01]|uniref:DUF6221 family protein n=1 Tax=Streptomyces sp. JS01 TaxID=1525753 RepID=UPI000503A873|nr:DUF6221 family protein [Streptomyces sp. JS01]KFK87830.1 hypothetical protein IX27_18235 [Streptomyces sp. JS01]